MDGKKTEVCITVDVEHSVAGAFSWPDRFAPIGEEVVNCVVDGKDQGLGFILESLARFGQTGTFFTEALQCAYFGDAPMQCSAQRIAAAGHDVQLHLHPCWLHFRNNDWRQPGFTPNDSCAGRTDKELDEMITLGFGAFARWGIPPPIALRTGGFRVDRAVMRAMARAGMRVSSNVSLGVYEPTEADLQLWAGRHLVEGVIEVPAMSYRTPAFRRPGASRWRTLAITATSKGETENLLWAARNAGVPTVVVLTHPFEFVSTRGFRFDDLRINRINQNRFLHLVEFLAKNPADFTTVTFAARANAWVQTGSAPAAILASPWWLAVSRAAQNVLSDWTHFT